MDFDATETPQDVVAALGLTVGQAYTVQNVSTVATLFLREAPVAPAAAARAFRIEAAGVFTIKSETSGGIWLWTDEAAGCPCILTEAV